jgi:hypothetical protein
MKVFLEGIQDAFLIEKKKICDEELPLIPKIIINSSIKGLSNNRIIINL